MDVETHVPLAVSLRLARVDSHPHSDRALLGPLLGRQRLLPLSRSRYRFLCTRECNEERIAFAVDLVAAVAFERLPQRLPMHFQRLRVPVRPEPLEQLCRALDVAE